MEGECVFCKIVAGELPSRKVYEDSEILAFHDINPAAPTHVLVIPKKHIPRVDDASEDDRHLLGHMVLKGNDIAEELGLTENGFRYVINCGLHGLQSVYHIHLHLLGGRVLSWPPG